MDSLKGVCAGGFVFEKCLQNQYHLRDEVSTTCVSGWDHRSTHALSV